MDIFSPFFSTIYKVYDILRARDDRAQAALYLLLGGFYAMCISWYYNVPCILTNPCVPPSKYIKGLVENYPSLNLSNFITQSNGFIV